MTGTTSDAVQGVLAAAFSHPILQNCNNRHLTTSLLLAAGSRLAPAVAAAAAAARVFYVGETEDRTAGMMRRAFQLAPNSVQSIAVADLDSAEDNADAVDEVARTQPTSIHTAIVDADTPGPCAKLMRVCELWGPRSLRQLTVVARPPRGEEADVTVIEAALALCTGGLLELHVPNAAVLASAHARSRLTAPPVWMRTVRCLSVAVAADADLAALAEAPRLLPALTDLSLVVRRDTLSAGAWRRAFQALLPQLEALSIEGDDTSLRVAEIFNEDFWYRVKDVNNETSADASKIVGLRRHRSDGGDQFESRPATNGGTALEPFTFTATFPLERLKLDQIDGCHAPLLTLLAAHAPNLRKVIIGGKGTHEMFVALTAMTRCESLTLLLSGLTDAYIAQILRGGMHAHLHHCWFSNNMFGFFNFAGARQTILSDATAFDGIVCPKLRKPGLIQPSDCTRALFPNAVWAEPATRSTQ